MKSNSRASQFTLIELLVVSAIVATLVSLLLPGLSRARGIAKAISCSSVERQMIQGYVSYSNDFNGFGPICSWNWRGNSAFWSLCGARASDNGGAALYCWSKGSICPEAQAALATAFSAGGFIYCDPTLSFGFAAYDNASTAAYPDPFRLDQVVNPSAKLCLVDSVSWDVGVSGSYYPGYYAVTGESYASNATAYRHPGVAANLACFDGHVSRPPWGQVYAARWTLYFPLK